MNKTGQSTGGRKVFFSSLNEEEKTTYDKENDLFIGLSNLYKRFGGRAFALANAQDFGHASNHKSAKIGGFPKHKLFKLLVDKALVDGKYLKKTPSGVCAFTDKFCREFFQDKRYDHSKYMRPVDHKGGLTDEDVLLLMCYYSDGLTFNSTTGLTTELAHSIGLDNSRTLRQVVDRLIAGNRFTVLRCEGHVDYAMYSVVYCSFLPETVRAVFAVKAN